MEVMVQRMADVEGGLLINYAESIGPLEAVQIPSEHVEDWIHPAVSKRSGGQAVIHTDEDATIKNFEDTLGAIVLWLRFLSVKLCSDMLPVRSNMDSLQPSQLVNVNRMFKTTPAIKLGD
ncbi:hypothetical protein CERSUDRAFT_99718 [Gelatoporia subvermispora B]|uniref:UTP--glucose-1-phosphate uridylyltransferase n=1 Tax=Ceriporiopsis subvermispora (strain B) TaxID=914234 RepID=M2QIU2_CERS8|nr:hypothetical protein CERSUDRAFT_99718 [Gelatoporia subvermispora B]